MGKSDVAKFLLDYVNHAKKYYRNLFKIAVDRRRPHLLDLILPNALEAAQPDSDGGLPIHWASNAFAPIFIEELLGKSHLPLDSVEQRDNRGRTPLFWTITFNSTENANALKKYGADVNAQDNEGKTLLHHRSNLDPIKMVRWALDNGTDVNGVDNDGRTPLHVAASNNEKDIAELLLERVSDPSLQNNNGQTPLAVAIKSGSSDVVELLRAREG